MADAASNSYSNLIADISSKFAGNFGISPQIVVSAAVIILVAGAILAGLPLLKQFGYRPAEASKAAQLIVLIVCYSLCSSMLLIINKVAVTYLPAPSCILLAQMVSCVAFVKGLGQAGVVQVEPLVYDKAKKFMVLVLAFVAILFTNVKALQLNPVDTIICFRASMPLVIAIIEHFTLGRELPNARSWAAMAGMLVGVALYVRSDIHYGWLAYLWLGLWYTFATFDMVYVKHVCDTVEMNAWTRTYYQNSLSVLPILGLVLVNGELPVLAKAQLSTTGVVAMLVSCVAGIGMSYFSFALRAAISATSFSLIGNVCKVLTIAVNLVIWDQHSDVLGTAALFLCLAMGAFYQQAPLRKDYVNGAVYEKVVDVSLSKSGSDRERKQGATLKQAEQGK